MSLQVRPNFCVVGSFEKFSSCCRALSKRFEKFTSFRLAELGDELGRDGHHGASAADLLTVRRLGVVVQARVALGTGFRRFLGGENSGRMVSPNYYDIGLNLTDPMYRGVYNGKQYHAPDVGSVLDRACKRGVKAALLTGSSLVESREAIGLANDSGLRDRGVRLKYTVGVHPCCVNEFADQDATIDNPSHDEESNQQLHLRVLEDPAIGQLKLKELYELCQERILCDKGRFGAVGEIGLDYDRFYYAGKEMQKIFFEEQLKLSCLIADPKIPLFLHMRNCCDDFLAILSKFVHGFADVQDTFGWRSILGKSSQEPIHYQFDPSRKFVTHSFTGSLDDLRRILALSSNSFVGLNGCSLKSIDNLECAAEVPVDRLLLETDAPWCDIRRTHESFQFLGDYVSPYKAVKRDKLEKVSPESKPDTMVKGRNEPCNMEQVAIVVANVKKMSVDELTQIVWANSVAIYGE